VGVEPSFARSALADLSLALRVTADENATTEDARDRLMRSVPFHYGWLIIMTGARLGADREHGNGGDSTVVLAVEGMT
jgi:hypothetical protein